MRDQLAHRSQKCDHKLLTSLTLITTKDTIGNPTKLLTAHGYKCYGRLQLLVIQNHYYFSHY